MAYSGAYKINKFKLKIINTRWIKYLNVMLDIKNC